MICNIFLHSVGYVFTFLVMIFDTKKVLVLSDAKSKGWEKMANVHGESRSQILEGTQKTSDAVQFSG